MQGRDMEIPTTWAGQNLQYYDVIDSTNTAAFREGDRGAEHGTLIVADHQTGGKGRRGRTWESPAGKNLYFSILLRPPFSPEKASMLTLVMAHSVAVAMERTVRDQIPEPESAKCCAEKNGESWIMPTIDIKWPNDILINGKKVSGILTELKLDQGQIGHVVIGVGINVKHQIFGEELAQKASTLEQEYGVEISRRQLLCNILQSFETDYEAFLKSENLQPFLQEYQARLLNRDAPVRVLDPKGEYEGTARGINEKGELLVERYDGSICHVYAGEVSIRGLQGYV